MPMKYQQVMDEMKRGMAPSIGTTAYKKYAQEDFCRIRLLLKQKLYWQHL